MLNINDKLKESIQRIEQLKNQKKSKERRDQEAKRKMEARRHFDLGRLVDKYFPEEDPVSFEKLLRALVGNPELFAELKEEVTKFDVNG